MDDTKQDDLQINKSYEYFSSNKAFKSEFNFLNNASFIDEDVSIKLLFESFKLMEN
jgi:hypothetical protein